MKKVKYILIIVLTTLVVTISMAKKEPNRQFKQILPERNQTHQKNESTGSKIGSQGNLSYKSTKSISVESIAREYIDHFIVTQKFNKSADSEFQLVSLRDGKVTRTARFKQVHKGVEVFGSGFTVSLNNDDVVIFETHSVFEIGEINVSKSSITEDEAYTLVSNYLGSQSVDLKKSLQKQVIYFSQGVAKLVYQIDYQFKNGNGHWQFLIDANTGEVIRAADMLQYATAQASVFDPDPLTTSGQSYGGGYVDGNDQNTNQLSQELKNYSIDVLNQNGTYFLTGEWAQSVDIEAPSDGIFSQTTNDFRNNRGENSFEAVNIYYHISEFLSYLNNDLNLNVKPYQYSTGIKFDAHGANGEDQSYYSHSGYLVFGEGCVDDGEDADVIIHELGHGIHDWITQGGLSQVDGLSEGTGDYFAQSYSRRRPDYEWNVNDQEHHHMFSWDGHNECWGGRTTNYSAVYPTGLVQQIHTDGQIWSTCLMKVWDELGHIKTDSMVVEGLSMTDSNTNQEQAAQAVLQAAGELGYASDLGFITNTFNSCGYDVSLGNQIVVSIETEPSQPNVGETTTFNANISNGEGPYSFSWDVNGDGETDGTAQSLTTKYSNIYSGDISVEVSGSNNSFGQTSKNVTIAGADIQLQQVVNISENLSQVCGNNDNVIDPGERWTALIDAKNVGQKTASNAYLALGKNRSSVSGSVGDNYGNQTVSCERQFIDISNTGTVKPWVTAGTQYPADDEGYVSLSLNQAFSHYGQNISSMVASSNGYFNTNTSAKGDDWNNDCPLPVVPDRDMVGARIAPMHADLNSSVFYQQFFNTCPRQAESGGNLACEVFMWQGADLWETTNIIESVDFQAILYPATSQWVFQYDGTGFDGSSSTTGMQNASATDGLTYACNTANSINTSTAVCTYNKNHLPSSNGFDFVKLETPIISLGNLSTNQSKTESLQFSIATNATCGTEFAINHEASVYDKGFNAGQNTILSGTIGQNGQCNVVSNCAIPTESNFIQPNNGLWWNPERSGNGVDLHTFNGSSLLYVMYTGKPDRSPIWYIANDADSFYNQYYNNILMVSFPGGYAANNQQVDTVGWSNTTFIDEKHAIQVRNIHGELSAEKIQMDQFDTDLTPNMHTGHYFAPSQSGWGQSVVTLGNTQVVITYIYDQQGNPFWTIASGTNDTNQKSVVTADSFCPHCPSVPMDVFTVGTMRMTFNGQSSGTINNYNISFPPNVTWNKTNLPIENLVPDED